MILADTSCSTIELEGLASIQRNELLAFVEDNRAINLRLAGRVGGHEAQGDSPSQVM